MYWISQKYAEGKFWLKAYDRPAVGPRPCDSARRAGVLFSLVADDSFLQIGVLPTRQQASAVERGQALLGLRQSIGHQVQLAELFKCSTVLQVHAPRGGVVALGDAYVGGLTFLGSV